MQEYDLVLRISPQEIEQQVERIAARINQDSAGQNLFVIGILKGSWMFCADLIRHLQMPVEIDFVRLASYGMETATCGEIRITKDIETPIGGRDVLVVEDIVDSGTTLAWYVDYLRKFQPASVRICALIDKYERRSVEVPLDYVCFRTEKGFLVGYGLDYAERHRNLPGIYEVQFSQ